MITFLITWSLFLIKTVASWSDYNWTRTQSHLVLKRTLNHLAKLACSLMLNWSVIKNFLKQKKQARKKANSVWIKTQKKIQNVGTLQNYSLKKCISKLPPQKYEHKQEKILTDKFLLIKKGSNKISKKQPCPTINSKMTSKFSTCSKTEKWLPTFQLVQSQ